MESVLKDIDGQIIRPGSIIDLLEKTACLPKGVYFYEGFRYESHLWWSSAGQQFICSDLERSKIRVRKKLIQNEIIMREEFQKLLCQKC